MVLFVALGCYVLTSFGWIAIPDKLDKRYLMIPCCFVLGCSALLIGPSSILHIPDILPIFIIGIVFQGLTGSNSAAFVSD